MMQFDYQAINDADQLVDGQIEAEDVKSALQALEAEGLSVQAIRQVALTGDEHREKSGGMSAHPPVELAAGQSAESETADHLHLERQALAAQMARILEAGKPLTPALRAYAAELPRGRYRRQLLQMATQLEHGGDADSVLASQQIEEQWIPLLSAFAVTQDPSQILRGFLVESRRANEGGRQLAYALAYPLIVTAIAVLLFIFLCLLVVPVFHEMYADFGMELPAATQWLLNTSLALRETRGMVFLIPLLIVAGLVLGARYLLPPLGRERLSDWIPLLGRGYRLSAWARFAQYLADLLRADVSVPQALRIAGRNAKRPSLRRAAQHLAAHAESGSIHPREFGGAEQFPATLLYALQVESSATSVQILDELSRLYDQQSSNRLSWVHGIVEPIGICVMAVLVGFVVLSLFLPLISLVQNLT